MSAVVHAPDGGIVGGALCEDPNGDTTTNEPDVSCTACLDVLETRPPGNFTRLARHTAELRATRRPGSAQRKATT